MNRNGRVTSYYTFDAKNVQEPFKYMARATNTGEIVVGYVVVARIGYRPKDFGKYYMEYNECKGYGFDSDFAYLGIKRVEIDPETIVPYNQLAEIKAAQENGYDILLEGNDLPGLRKELKIAYNEEIPQNLYHQPYSKKYIKRFKKYGAYSTVIPRKTIVENIIEDRKVEKRTNLLESLKEFWEGNKEKNTTILVGIGNVNDVDGEIIREYDEEVFSHSLTGEYFNTMEECITDFVKCVDPEDVVGFNSGMKREGL